MRKLIIFAAFVCFAALHVNAQTEETETSSQRYLRLSKTADENPSDWKAQLEIAHVLLDKEGGFYNQQRGARYYERIYNLAIGYNPNKEIPDSVIQESCMMLMTAASDKKDLDKALFYMDELKHAKKMGVDIEDGTLNMCDMFGWMYKTIKEDELGSLTSIMDLRERITKMGLPGIENTDFITAVFFENVLKKYKTMFGDKLLEMTLDGKKYVFISMGDWNIEMPLSGWMGRPEDTNDEKDEKDEREEQGNSTLVYGEDGIVYNKLHGQMEGSFFCNKDGVVPKDNTNTRLISVTPEQRQKMVEAYHNYMKKASKEKKKK